MRIRGGVVLRDYEGRVLLVGAASDWQLPEVAAASDETPLEAAERGLAETLGVHRRPGRLLLADATAGTLTFLFDGGRLDDLAEAAPEAGARYADVAELDGLVGPEVSRRIATVVSETGDVYAEDGRNRPGAGWGVPSAETS